MKKRKRNFPECTQEVYKTLDSVKILCSTKAQSRIRMKEKRQEEIVSHIDSKMMKKENR